MGVFTVTQQYVVSGDHALESPVNTFRITNTVTITPIPSNAQLAAALPAVTFTAQTSIPVGISNTISLTKAAFYSPTAHAVLTYPTTFDTVTYVYTVTNNSRNPVNLFQLFDDQFGLLVDNFTGIPLAPFESRVFFSKPTKLLEDVVNNNIVNRVTAPLANGDNVGALTNTAVVTGNMGGTPIVGVVSSTAVTSVPITYVQSISVEKVAIPGTTISATAPYSQVGYRYIITNSGSVTQVIQAGGLQDWHLSATSVISYVAFSNTTAITINPGTSTTLSFNYTVSETEVISGHNASLGRISYLTNTVEIIAHPVTDTFNLYPNLIALITSPDVAAGAGAQISGGNRISATIVSPLIFTPNLQIIKRALITEVGLNQAIEYEFTIKNIGNMTLRYISGTDFITRANDGGGGYSTTRLPRRYYYRPGCSSGHLVILYR